MSFETRSLTPEEVDAFGADLCPVNWGVIWQGEILACFQAEPEDCESLVLNVHANVKRRALHPAVTAAYAKTFSDRLVELGASELMCRIKPENRAALRMAKAAGYRESGTEDGCIVLRRK